MSGGEEWVRRVEQRLIEFDRRLRASGTGTPLQGGSANLPNVPMTTNFHKVNREGNWVTVRTVVTLTAGIGNALIDMPFPFATGTLINDAHLIGKVRGIRNGVAWFIGDICPVQLSGPSRAAIYLSTGSGAQWSAANPAAWAAGDRWGLDYEYEAAPL